ncbi:MAG: PhaM family polyhydroxyalkanoate granule multifunctional regulatory protein [Burkholderiaceae bacterium]
MTDASSSFTKLVPGFDFLQGLVKNAGAALPSMGQWVAPTLNPEELAKRIEELRTVQFWLEQNARMLATTIQAIEVQRMTLSTLKTMNVQMADLRDSLKVPMPDVPATDTTSAREEVRPARKPARQNASTAAASPSGATPAFAGAVDPTEWWSALTKQFTQIAATAMKDGAADAAKNPAGVAAQPSIDAAGQTPRKAPGTARKTPRASRASKAEPRKRAATKATARRR